MNVAIISYHTCPLATLGGKATGGMNVYVRELTRFLGQNNIHADVFTRSQDDCVPHILHDLGCGNRVVHIPAGPETPLPKADLISYLDEFTDGILAFAESKQISYDVIHSHYWLSGLAAGQLKANWNIPLIQMFHTLALLKNKIAKSPKELESETRVNGEKKVLQLADRIVVATIDERQQLDKLYRAKLKKVATIPPGVDTTRFYPIPEDEAKAFLNIPKDEKMLLFVGRIEPLKGIDTLIKAISQMRKSDVMSTCPHYLYIIGGDPNGEVIDEDSEIQRLKRLCHDLGVDDLIIFMGKKDQDTLPYYYSAAEIVVMPSNYESFGMVALEAMACATPVVATQVGGLQHLVQDGITGFIVPHDDPDALEEKLTQLICQPDLCKEMALNAVLYARSYSWEKITPQIINLYKETINEFNPSMVSATGK
jgi:D-inositol-3-phosphate glycosyltransferase